MENDKYTEWINSIENGDYGELVSVEENPYFITDIDVEESLVYVVQIAKRNNISLAELTKAIVTVGQREGLLAI